MRRWAGLLLYGLALRLLPGCPCPLCELVRIETGPGVGRAVERRAHRAAWRAGRIR